MGLLACFLGETLSTVVVIVCLVTDIAIRGLSEYAIPSFNFVIFFLKKKTIG